LIILTRILMAIIKTFLVIEDLCITMNQIMEDVSL